MTAKDSNFRIAEHDWQSQSYVDEWISRDVQRDGVRRPRLREMLSLASLERTAPLPCLMSAAATALCPKKSCAHSLRSG